MRRTNRALPAGRLAIDNRGQARLLSVVMLSVVLGLTGAFVSYVTTVQKATTFFSARAAARQAAQSGLDKAVWCLNQSVGTNCGIAFGSSFLGETNKQVGTNTYYTTTVATNSNTSKTVTSVGYYPTAAHPIATVTLLADATVTDVNASFFYGVQTGNGGFVLGGNASVIGNIYANGPVTGGNGSFATGNVWVAGGTALTADQSQEINSENYVFAQVSTIADIGQSFKLSSGNVVNKIQLHIRKTGNPGDLPIKIVSNSGGSPTNTVIGSTTLDKNDVSTSAFGWVEASFSTPPALVGNTTYWLVIDGSANNSNYYTIGSWPNNGYGNGVGKYTANWNIPVWIDAARDFTFRIYTGGVITSIDNVDVQGEAHANTISNLTVGGDAYYQTISNTTVGGTSHPGTADPGPQDMPISDTQIQDWMTEAAAGGTIAGDYHVVGSVTLGPKKITGNLTFDNNATLTMNGTLYVVGSITTGNNSLIKLAPGYGSSSGMLLADGRVTISNNTGFQGSGTTGSYVLITTTNGSLDDALPAMSLLNNSDNSIFYASKGVVSISNNASVKEVTGFKIVLANNASVQYESGLANVNFSSGPGGSWVLTSGSTRELR